MIKTEGICKWYRGHSSHKVSAVQDVTLSIVKNSFVVFKGPSGSGKTTLLNIIGTLDRPSAGEVFINGSNVTRFSDIALSGLRREKDRLYLSGLLPHPQPLQLGKRLLSARAARHIYPKPL